MVWAESNAFLSSEYLTTLIALVCEMSNRPLKCCRLTSLCHLCAARESRCGSSLSADSILGPLDDFLPEFQPQGQRSSQEVGLVEDWVPDNIFPGQWASHDCFNKEMLNFATLSIFPELLLDRLFWPVDLYDRFFSHLGVTLYWSFQIPSFDIYAAKLSHGSLWWYPVRCTTTDCSYFCVFSQIIFHPTFRVHCTRYLRSNCLSPKSIKTMLFW